MKKRAWLVLILLGATVFSRVAVAAGYSGGNGTPEEPYHIATADDWIGLTNTAADWGQHFVLMADIDFSGAALTPLGNSATHFTGTVNGNGYVLRNGVINRPLDNLVGLFGIVTGGAIHDLGVDGIIITGGNYVGGLAGNCNNSTITACFTTGPVVGKQFVGGLTGLSNQAVSLSYAKGPVTGQTYVGGLVGYKNSGTVASCYARGAVAGNDKIGGLIGYAASGTVISYCAATGMVTGTSEAGGLVGAGNGSAVTTSYWDTDTSGLAVSAGGEGRTTDAMTYPYGDDTFVGWDFKTVWAADTEYSINNGYPYLRYDRNGCGCGNASGKQLAPEGLLKRALADWLLAGL